MPRSLSSANASEKSDSNVRSVIGANIKARRIALKLKQQELADRFGVSRSAISQYENATGEVNAGDLPRLARILGIHLLDFYQPPSVGVFTASDGTSGDSEAAVEGAGVGRGGRIPEQQDVLDLTSIFENMTHLERKTVLRIARALKGTLGP
jgi:transcriptional regulator with XRE-family HTH domain